MILFSNYGRDTRRAEEVKTAMRRGVDLDLWLVALIQEEVSV